MDTELTVLARELRDPDERVRLGAAYELARIGGSAAIEVLLAAMPEDATDTEPAMASALLHLHNWVEIELLIACLTSDDPSVSPNALRGLAERGRTRTHVTIRLAGVAPVDAELKKQWDLLQAVRDLAPALYALVNDRPLDDLDLEPAPVMSRKAIDGLIPYLRHKETAYRIWAAEALARHDTEETGRALAVESLKGALGDEDRQVRFAALSALARQGSQSDIASIAPLLEDPEWDIRSEALDALWEIGTSDAIAPLQHAAENDPDEDIRARAAFFVGALRKVAK